MYKIVKCSEIRDIFSIECRCGSNLPDILIGSNSYIEIVCPHCGNIMFICTKNGTKIGPLDSKIYYNHHKNDYSTKNYFKISCLTYGDEIEFHLGERSYAEFKCPHCGKYVAVKTTNVVTKYLKPLYIDKRGFNQNRIL